MKKKRRLAAERREAVLRALHAESKVQERQQILDRLALQPSQRTNFLRIKLSGGGSCL